METLIFVTAKMHPDTCIHMYNYDYVCTCMIIKYVYTHKPIIIMYDNYM